MLVSLSLLTGFAVNRKEAGAAGYNLSNPTTDSNGVTTWDTIYFGNYYQSNDSTKEPIRWRVLSVNGDDAFLLADQNLDVQPYNEERTNVTWETCTLRTWLNSTFKNTAFSAAEQAAIRTTNVVNEDNPYYGTEGGNNTSDQIFLLSISEAGNPAYGFNGDFLAESETRVARNTAYIAGKNEYMSPGGSADWWWLRSPGFASDFAAVVSSGGWGLDGGLIVDGDDVAVRPALHLNLSSTSLWRKGGTVSSSGGGGGDQPEPTLPVETEQPDSTTESTAQGVELKIGSKTEFKVPSDVPLLGGGKVGLDFGQIPVQFNRKGNTYRIGIGVSDLTKFTEEGWTTFRKFVDTQKESYRKGIEQLLKAKQGTGSMGMKVKPKISCFGYAEGTITQNGVESVAGRVIVEIKVKATQEWQTYAVVVPVVVKFTGEVGAKLNCGIDLDFASQEVYLDGKLDLTLPKIRLSGGVGVSHIADVSVYGEADNKISIESRTPKNGGDKVSASLTGKLGVSASLFFMTYEKEFLSGTWNYYDSSKTQKKSRQVLSESDEPAQWTLDTTKPQEFYEDAFVKAVADQTGITAGLLQSDIYGGSDPELLVTENGTKVLTYIQAVEGRSNGNQYAAVYSIYDETTRNWSEPRMIADDATGDFNLQAKVKGNSICFVWNNIKEEVAADAIISGETYDEFAALCEVEAATLDVANRTVEQIKITDNHVYDYHPALAVSGDEIYVAYVENDSNDMLNPDGTNIIHIGKIKDGIYEEVEQRTETGIVQNLQMGLLDGGMTAAYVIQKEQNELHALSLQNGHAVLAAVSDTISKPAFARLEGMDSLLWHVQSGESGSLCSADAMDAAPCVLIADAQINNGYFVVNDRSRDMILCPVSQGESGSKLTAYMVEDGVVSEPADIAEYTGMIGNVSAAGEGENMYLLYTNASVQIGDGAMNTQRDLYISYIPSGVRLSAGDVNYLEEDVYAGNNVPMTVQVTNNNLEQLSEDITVSIRCNGEEIGSTVLSELAFGETKDVSIDVTIPEDVTETNSFTVVLLSEGKTVDTETLEFGRTNLAVNACMKDDTIPVTVNNDSGFDTAGTLEIRDTNADGTLIEEIALGTVAAGGTWEKTLDLASYREQGYSSLFFLVKTDAEEQFRFDNEVSLYIGNQVLKNLMSIEASKSETAYYTGDSLTVDDLTVYALYDDGTKQKVESYTTNAKDISMGAPGVKELTISYEEVGMVCQTSLPVTVSKKTPVTVPDTAPDIAPDTVEYQPAVSVDRGESSSRQNTITKPKRVTLTSVKKLKKKITLKYKKIKGVKGYQIQYARNKKFRKSKSKYTSKTSYTIKKLKRKKTYYIRVRAYKMNQKKKVYGKWSKVKKVKVK